MRPPIKASLEMTVRIKIMIVLILLLLPLCSHSGILSPDRSIDWSACGVPGGIPDVPAGVDVQKDLQAKGDGITDDSPAFQAAIEACPEGSAVVIPAGQYLLRSPITISKGIVLRGAGRGRTTLLFDLNSAVPAISVVLYDEGAWQEIQGDAVKGAMALRVEDAGKFKPGEHAQIVQDNDPAKMYTRPEWEQDWAREAVGQMVPVRSADGTVLALGEPLHLTFDPRLHPRVRPQRLVRGAGIERLHLKRLDKHDGDMMALKKAAHCWVRDVESEYAYRCHATFNACFGCEVRDSVFHHAHDYGGGGHGYGVELNRHTANGLVAGNRFRHLRHSMLVQVGANGNVFSGNVSTDPYATSDDGRSGSLCDISLHGHWTFMNLFEGNTVQFIHIGDYWGPAGPGNTFLRNRVLGTRGIVVDDRSDGQNFIGNEIVNGTLLIRGGTDLSATLMHGNSEQGKKQWDAKISDREIPETLYKTGK